jgi:hypothetical protein
MRWEKSDFQLALLLDGPPWDCAEIARALCLFGQGGMTLFIIAKELFKVVNEKLLGLIISYVS